MKAGVTMKKSFANVKPPVLAAVIKETTPKAAMAAIKNSTLAGANAFDLHISVMNKDSITAENLKPVFDFTEKPILALHYNQGSDGSALGESDEERVRQLLVALDAGAVGIDLQGYTFEPDRNTKATFRSQWIAENMRFVSACPNEVTLNPETIQKQTDLIEQVHAKGGEVLLSTHTGCFLDCEQVTDLLDFLHRRKPDIIKLVTSGCDTDEQLAEYFKTMLYVKDRYSDTKIHYHCNGKKTKLSRLIGPMLGAHIAFCVDRYNERSVLDKLPLKETAEIYNLLEKI